MKMWVFWGMLYGFFGVDLVMFFKKYICKNEFRFGYIYFVNGDVMIMMIMSVFVLCGLYVVFDRVVCVIGMGEEFCV